MFHKQYAPKTFIPVLFGHGSKDIFIQPHHCDRIYDAYAVTNLTFSLYKISSDIDFIMTLTLRIHANATSNNNKHDKLKNKEE